MIKYQPLPKIYWRHIIYTLIGIAHNNSDMTELLIWKGTMYDLDFKGSYSEYVTAIQYTALNQNPRLIYTLRATASINHENPTPEGEKAIIHINTWII